MNPSFSSFDGDSFLFKLQSVRLTALVAAPLFLLFVLSLLDFLVLCLPDCEYEDWTAEEMTDETAFS